MEESGDKKKNILKIISIETVFIGIVVIGMFALLNYLGIFPASKLFNLFVLPGQNSAGDKTVSLSSTQFDKIEKDISAKSNVSGYTIELLNKKELIDLLSAWEIYNKNYDYLNEGSTKKIPLKIIFLHLVSDKRYISKTFIDTLSKEKLQTGLTINPGIFDVFLYVDAKTLSGDIKKANMIVNRELLSRFYSLAYENNGTVISLKGRDELEKLFKKHEPLPFLSVKTGKR